MKNVLLFISLLSSTLLYSQKEDSIMFSRISKHILTQGNAYEDLRELCKDIGHRFSGSTAYDKSVVWAAKKLKEAGADNVWLQDVLVPVWVRGKEQLHIKVGKNKWKKINFLSIGNSEGTGGKNMEGELLVVNSKEAFDSLTESDVKNKIVLFNYPFKQEFVVTGRAYRDAGKYRRSAASWVYQKGGKAALIRSLTSNFDDIPHTGSMQYDAKDLKKIPAGAIGAKTADELERLSSTNKISVRWNSNATMKGEKRTHTVIGEIEGKKNKDVIVVSGHLDSWDVGEGASDDGAGIVQSIEVLRSFKKLGIQNQHRIRVVCYANEENGVRGGNTYANAMKNEQEKHIFAIESDAGGFTPRGISLDMEDSKRKQIQAWSPLFFPYGIYEFTAKGSGTDIAPMKESKVPLAGLVVDSQRYFDIHHTAEDTFEKVNRRELLLGAVAMTQLIYMIDRYW